MKERNKRTVSTLLKVLRTFGSLIMLAAILYFSVSTIRFCLSLFATGDYLGPFSDSVVVSKNNPVNTGTSSQNEEEPGPVTQVSQATITVAGDIMMHMPIVRSGETDDGYNFDEIFSYISSYVGQANYAVANLETTLAGTDGGNTYTGYPQFNSPDAITDGAKAGGFDMLLTGNNHCYDYGHSGMDRTLEIIRDRGLDSLGTTRAVEEADYIVKDINGIKVGMICYTYAEIGDNRTTPSVNSLTMSSDAGTLVNAFDYDKLDLFYNEMTSYITKMKEEGAETIVVYIHWGDEYVTKANDDQTAIAQKLCDLGVDVIAGGHPHVVQPIDLLTSTTDPAHTTVCLYSMGNFLSNQRSDNIALDTGHSEDGLLFSFTLTKYSDGTVWVDSADLLPTWVLIRGTGDDRIYRILPLDYDISNWSDAFDLTDGQLQDVKDSYNRTAEIITSGLNKVQSALSEAKTAREAAYAEAAA